MDCWLTVERKFTPNCLFLCISGSQPWLCTRIACSALKRHKNLTQIPGFQFKSPGEILPLVFCFLKIFNSWFLFAISIRTTSLVYYVHQNKHTLKWFLAKHLTTLDLLALNEKRKKERQENTTKFWADEKSLSFLVKT